MNNFITNFEEVKIKVDQIADARGIIFTNQLHFVAKALEQLEKGQVLNMFCSDTENKEHIPLWVEQHGHVFLSFIEERGYFKILIVKG